MEILSDILESKMEEKNISKFDNSIELIKGKELPLSRSTVNFFFYGEMEKYNSEIKFYMAVVDKATSTAFIFGGVYNLNGIENVFIECTTDKIDEEIQLHFVNYEWCKKSNFLLRAHLETCSCKSKGYF